MPTVWKMISDRHNVSPLLSQLGLPTLQKRPLKFDSFKNECWNEHNRHSLSQLSICCHRSLYRPNGFVFYLWFLVFILNLFYDNSVLHIAVLMPSVLWRCWLGGRKSIRPVKNFRVVGCWRGYLSGARCRLAYGPADATATHCLLLQ